MGSVHAWQAVPARHAAPAGRRTGLVGKLGPWAASRILRGVEIVEYKRVMMLASLSRLSPGGLTDRLYQLRTQERALLVELLWHIAEVDRRRLYLEMAFPSLFAFATGFLGYTKAAAFRRTTAARLEPISEQLRVLRVTVGADFAKDLDAVRAALSHKIPDGDLAALLHECLRVTLAAATKRRRGSGRARADVLAPTDSTSRYVPAAIRDAVWRRDDARCAFVAADGRRCDSTHQLELHHLVPFARGGAATVDGLALRCKAHNLHEARRDF